jgi:chromosome segregation ATPase
MLKKVLLLTVATVTVFNTVYASSDPKEGHISRVATTKVDMPRTEQARTATNTIMQVVQDLESTVDALAREKGLLEEKITGLQRDQVSASAAIEQANTTISQLNQELQAKQAEHTSVLQAATTAAEQKAAEAKAKEIQILQREMDSIVQQRDGYSRELEDAKGMLNELRSAAASNDSAMHALKAQLEEAKSSNQQLTIEKARDAEQLSSLQRQISEKVKMILSLETEKEATSKKIADQQAELASLRESGKASAAELQQKQLSLDATLKDVQGIQASLTEATKELNSVRAARDRQVAELTVQKAMLGVELSEAEARNQMILGYHNELAGMMNNFHKGAAGVNTTELKTALNAAQDRVSKKEIEFGTSMSAAHKELEVLRAQLATNSAALADLEHLKIAIQRADHTIAEDTKEIASLREQLAAATVESNRLKVTMVDADKYHADLDDLRASYESKLSVMVSADEFEAARNSLTSLSEQLAAEKAGRATAENQLVRVTEDMRRMSDLAAGNAELAAAFKKQAEDLEKAKAKADAEREQATKNQALADAARAQQLEVRKAERARLAASMGVRSKADVDADRERAKAATEARTVAATKIPTAVQLVPAWQFLRDTAVNNGMSIGLQADSVMNGMDGLANRGKLVGQTLNVKGQTITISGVDPKDIWPEIRELARKLNIPGYEQLGAEELVQAIRNAK